MLCALDKRHGATIYAKTSVWRRESMSTSQGSDPARQTVRDLFRWFGADDSKLAAAERIFGEIAERVESRSVNWRGISRVSGVKVPIRRYRRL